MKALMGLLLLLVSGSVFAGDAIYTGLFSNKALDGYDTVAYFTEGKPVKGNSAYITEYKGADWYFSSKQNRDLFVKNPDKYAPQYGGFCAWAVAAKNDRAPGDPQQWTIVKDTNNVAKLYLNYDKTIKQRWEQDISGFIVKGDKNWPTLLAN
ncbi:YHS domain protein [Photobacterium frigidiphilum]|uniref:YHS domain protein n=1 Tax=Photobacterium frigidiphilum TaxID=264736 RepID=A0A2T3J9I1_9GAMM|nr:YHS domain-containing (seleno)protein [Photobacterium frigidiphilum]PSU45494.1 YHS domain protein [Photobacterium frigidiphilum]